MFEPADPDWELLMLISPLVASVSGGAQRIPSGTGFFIGSQVAVTALHVLQDLAEKLGQPAGFANRGTSGLLDLGVLHIGMRQHVTEREYINFLVTHAFRSAFCEDLVLLFLAPSGEETAAWSARRGAYHLELEPPKVGDAVEAAGFAGGILTGPNTVHSHVTKSPGHVSDVYPDRMSSKNPFPGFAVHTDSPGGMSGGPVVSSPYGTTGFVTAGVGEAGDTLPVPERVRGEEPPVTFVGCLWPLLGDVFQAPDLNGGQSFTLRDLAYPVSAQALSPYEVSIRGNVHEDLTMEEGLIEEVRLVQPNLPQTAWPIARRTRLQRNPLEELLGR